MNYFFVYDPTTGNILGRGTTPDGTFNKNDIECTKDQYDNFLDYRISLATVPPSIISNLNTILVYNLVANANNVLNTTCSNLLVGGFVSSALGSQYTYPSTIIDQGNLSDLANSGLSTVMQYCSDSTGKWDMVKHTDVQIKEVFQDWVNFKTTQSYKLLTLKKQISAIAALVTNNMDQTTLTGLTDKITAIVW